MRRPSPQHKRAAGLGDPSPAASASERLKAAALDALPAAVLIVDQAGHLLTWTPAAERLFDPSETPSIGSILDVANLWNTETPSVGGLTRTEVRTRDGAKLPADLTVHRFSFEGLDHMAVEIRDRTEAGLQNRGEAPPAASTTALLAGIAHELNNPLAVLLAQATLLRDKAPTTDVEARAAKIEMAAQRAGRIVRSFLALAQQRPPLLAPMTLDDALDDAIDISSPGLLGAGIALRRVRGVALPVVNADRDLLGQVFSQLIGDAQAALQGRGADRLITVTTGLERESVVVAIGHNGGDPAPVSAGTGVGLSLCRSILEAHAGRLTVDASSDGGLVRVMLPASRPAPAIGPARALAILVVDDEIEVAQSLAELIEMFGHRVLVEVSSDNIMARLGQQRFDGVFTDLRMPGLDGLALRREIAARDPALASRTVIVTGDSVSMAAAPDPLTHAADHFSLAKPFTAAAVKAALDRIAAP